MMHIARLSGQSSGKKQKVSTYIRETASLGREYLASGSLDDVKGQQSHNATGKEPWEKHTHKHRGRDHTNTHTSRRTVWYY